MNNLCGASVLLPVAMVVLTGCGFKSDLYLPDNPPPSINNLPTVDSIELPPLPAAEAPQTPGVVVEIPEIDDEQRKKNKNIP